MASVVGSDVPYPDAALIFDPCVPRGSRAFGGDFKVSVGGLADLGRLLGKTQEGALALDDWKALADQHRLTAVSRVEAACDPALLGAENLLQQYATAFRRDQVWARAVVPFTCRAEDRELSSRDVGRLIGEEKVDVLIKGPSGCAKSLLAMNSALALTERGGIPVLIPCGNYSGNLKTVLNGEVRELIDSSAAKLLGAARALNRPLLFVVDGFNECPEAHRASLTRRVSALARWWRGGMLVTSQIPMVREDRLGLREVEVPPPDMDTKRAIALDATGGEPLGRQSEDLLGVVASGLEARLIGEVGQKLGPGGSRHALFDAFARRLLGDSSREGVRLLSELAGALLGRVAFSLSRRDFDRFLDEEGGSEEVTTLVQTVGLLTSRGDRFSFGHEMFFDAFAAENVVRCAAGRSAPVLRALSSPEHAGRKALIIGAIDDALLRQQILEGLAHAQSVAACVGGECGQEAREWAEARCAALWKDLRAEALGVSFCISEDVPWGVAFDGASLRKWTPSERAFLAAMPEWLARKQNLEVALDTVRVLDERIPIEEARLRDQARGLRVPLGEALFACGFDDASGRVAGITAICRGVAHGLLRGPCDELAEVVQAKLGAGNLSRGEMYLLLMLSRHCGLPARLITQAIESHWAGAPYHLKIALMDGSLMCMADDEPARRALVSVIEGLPLPDNIVISTSMVEALQRLGALEDPEREHVDIVVQQIRECLADPGSADRRAMAYGVYSSQFDHPYSGAYHEVVAGLREDDRKRLLMMAVKGAPDTMAFLLPLLLDLAAFGDPDTGDCFSQWAALPPTDSFMRQDAIVVFAVAHVALGRLGCPLRSQADGGGYSAEALAACGAVLYWLNRHDLDRVTKQRSCAAPLRVLIQHDRGAALDVIRFCEYELRQWGLVERLKVYAGAEPPELSIVSAFPDEAVEVCRHALADPSSQTSYFGSGQSYDDRQNLSFAMGVLARHGSSLELLPEVVDPMM